MPGDTKIIVPSDDPAAEPRLIITLHLPAGFHEAAVAMEALAQVFPEARMTNWTEEELA